MSASNWKDALDLQLRLHRAATQGRVPAIMWPQGMAEDAAEAMLKTVPGLLSMAAPIHVAEEIADLWDAARHDFTPEGFDESEPFVPNGFALLPKGAALRASEGSFVARALAWGAFPGGVSVLAFAHDNDFMKELGAGSWGGRGDWAITFADVLTVETERDEEALRHVQAFWRLGREFVADPERAPRGLRRAAQRAGVRAGEYVTVLRLRRHVRAAAEAAAEPGNWSCQWIVRGHWRRQWYPSLGEHRQRYIAPHIKGPADKPLRVTDRAVEFVR